MSQVGAEVGSRARFEAFGRLPAKPSLWRRSVRLARKKPLGTISLFIIVFMWVVAIFAPAIAPFGWDEVMAGPRFNPPDGLYWFGTDSVGQDVFSRVVWGARLSLGLSLFSSVAGVLIGSLFGMVSGYFMGYFDLIWQRVVDAFMALPTLVLLMAIVAVLGSDIVWVLVGLVVITVPRGGRVTRSATIAVREMPYVEGAKVVGCSHWRILIRYILPNVMAPIIIMVTVSLAGNLLTQAALSFLGLVSSNYPDWGGMLNRAARRYLEPAPWLVIAPGAVISLAVLSYNLLGDALRDVLDPRLRGS